MFLGSYFLLLPAILSCAHFISWLCKIEGTEHTQKKRTKGLLRIVIVIAICFPTELLGVLRTP